MKVFNNDNFEGILASVGAIEYLWKPVFQQPSQNLDPLTFRKENNVKIVKYMYKILFILRNFQICVQRYRFWERSSRLEKKFAAGIAKVFNRLDAVYNVLKKNVEECRLTTLAR